MYSVKLLKFYKCFCLILFLFHWRQEIVDGHSAADHTLSSIMMDTM